MTIEERTTGLEAQPDISGVESGSMNFGDDRSSRRRAGRGIIERAAGGIALEEAFDVGHVVSAIRWLEEGIPAALRINLVFGVPGGIDASPEALAAMTGRCRRHVLDRASVAITRACWRWPSCTAPPDPDRARGRRLPAAGARAERGAGRDGRRPTPARSADVATRRRPRAAGRLRRPRTSALAGGRRRDARGDPRGGARAVRAARLPRATSMRRLARARGGDLPLVLEQGDSGRPPGRLHGAAHRARRRRRWSASSAPPCGWPRRCASTSSSTGPPPGGVRDRQRDQALTEEPRRALIAKRDEYQRMFSEMIRDGIRDGSRARSDVHVATYAILLQCTGVALWFDPRGRSRSRRSPSCTWSSCSARCRPRASCRRGDRDRLARGRRA